ncbi:phage gene 29 protein family protein [Prescottella equi]|uniref:phage gene 29 protein family protein n=1 Tax=Rhodococcus hoagii TaxID=43767 RepID=UPI0021D4B781|nr:DUF2744 domain-containing protein [Prescottella equi]
MQSRIPLQAMCDQSDPKTAFKWALVGLPWAGPQKFTPPSDLADDWSEHLWRLGFRHHPELQELKLIPPPRGQQHPQNATMQWVGIDEPEPPPAVIPDVSSKEYTRNEQAAIAEQLYRDGVIPTPEPEMDKATVERTFNPADYTPSEVRGYLIGAEDRERARVLALEMTGKARPQILNDPRWKGM